jgi:ABC-type polysaccharide/polyol phosphate transport system ATPase subunit
LLCRACKELLVKSPKQYFREFWALKDVSFEVKKAKPSASSVAMARGKSTLLQMICGTLNPNQRQHYKPTWPHRSVVGTRLRFQSGIHWA